MSKRWEHMARGHKPPSSRSLHFPEGLITLFLYIFVSTLSIIISFFYMNNNKPKNSTRELSGKQLQCVL